MKSRTRKRSDREITKQMEEYELLKLKTTTGNEKKRNEERLNK